MPSSIGYEFGTPVTLESNGGAITSGSILATTNIYDPTGDTQKYTEGNLTVTYTFGTAPVDNTVIEIHATISTDGTNYTDAPTSTVQPAEGFVGGLNVAAVTTARRRGLRGIRLSGHRTQFYLRNTTGQSISAGWTAVFTPRRRLAS